VKERGGVKGVARSEAKAEAKKKLTIASQKAQTGIRSGMVAALGTGWVFRSLTKSGRKSNRK
jgi:hypothetical protein